MLWWLAAVVVCLLVWAILWRRSPALSFAILVGVLLAWLLSYLLRPAVSDMETIPIWLPPLPLATIALLLFIYGAIVWIRGNEALPQKKRDKDGHH